MPPPAKACSSMPSMFCAGNVAIPMFSGAIDLATRFSRTVGCLASRCASAPLLATCIWSRFCLAAIATAIGKEVSLPCITAKSLSLG